MLACYIVAREGYSRDQAIKEVRRRLMGSIETPQQEQAVRDFAKYLKGKKSR